MGSHGVSSVAYKRLNKEWSDMLTYPHPEVSYGAFADGWLQLQGTITGSADTVYENGVFMLDIKVPDDYPFRPPRVKFITKIYHPNIGHDGWIDLDILGAKWGPALTIKKVLLNILKMLSEPRPDDPLEFEIARIYKNNRPLFDKTAREWVRLYAT